MSIRGKSKSYVSVQFDYMQLRLIAQRCILRTTRWDQQEMQPPTKAQTRTRYIIRHSGNTYRPVFPSMVVRKEESRVNRYPLESIFSAKYQLHCLRRVFTRMKLRNFATKIVRYLEQSPITYLLRHWMISN